MLMKKAGLVFAIAAGLSTLFTSGCSSRKTTLGLDVNVYLHPSSADPADILLQTAIARRLIQNTDTRDSLIHVRVEDRVVVLTGAAKADIRKQAEALARATKLTLNDEDIVPKDVTNRIEPQ